MKKKHSKRLQTTTHQGRTTQPPNFNLVWDEILFHKKERGRERGREREGGGRKREREEEGEEEGEEEREGGREMGISLQLNFPFQSNKTRQD